MTDKDPYDSVPALPDVEEIPVVRGVDKVRVCQKCGVEATIISTFNGVSAKCPQCGDRWPVGGVAPQVGGPQLGGRGIQKTVYGSFSNEEMESESPPSPEDLYPELFRRTKR